LLIINRPNGEKIAQPGYPAPEFEQKLLKFEWLETGREGREICLQLKRLDMLTNQLKQMKQLRNNGG
jgi:hypothetical protein